MRYNRDIMIDASTPNLVRKRSRGLLVGLVLFLAGCLALLLLAAGLLWVRRQRLPPGLNADPNSAGLLVTYVEPGTPAALAGITRGTIVFAVDEQAVDERAALEAALANRPGTVEVTLLILRGDRPERLRLTLAPGPPRLGVTVLGHAETGARPQTPVGSPPPALPVVARVVAGSPAEAAGFLACDIVIAVDDRPVDSVAALLEVLSALRPGDVVPFTVQRAGATERLIVAVGRRAGDPDRPFVGLQLPPDAR